jgi:hypothetical protein
VSLEEKEVGDFGTAKDYRVAISEVLKAGVSPRQSGLLAGMRCHVIR